MTNKWYIVNVVAGQENRICDDINKLSKENEFIKEAFIPIKKIFKHVRGKKVEAAQKLAFQRSKSLDYLENALQ